MISVIIPVYNGAKCIKRCLQSVLQQSYSDLEIIIVDDGSTDKTFDICTEYAKIDSRIRLFRQKNAGVSMARNRGLDEATGEYITFVDSDDYLPPMALELLVERATPNADLVIGMYEEHRFGRIKRTSLPNKLQTNEIKKCFESIDKYVKRPWGKLFRRSIINTHEIRFLKNVPYGEDTVFNLIYCKHIQKVQMIPDIVYCYNLGGFASSVRYYPNMNAFHLKLVEAYFDFFGGKENVPNTFLKEILCDQLKGSIMHYIGHCRFKEAIIKTEETLAVFVPHLDEKSVDRECYSEKEVQYILGLDAKGLVRCMKRENWRRILLRKIKYLLYSPKTKREVLAATDKCPLQEIPKSSN